MLVDIDVRVCVLSVSEETEFIEETHLHDLVTTTRANTESPSTERQPHYHSPVGQP